MRGENKLKKKIWPLNLEGPQNYSSNERVKTLHMYSFYKNTLTFNCCFSNLSLSYLSWEDAAEHISWQGGAGWPPVWSPGTLNIVDSSLSSPYFTSSFLCLLLQRTSRISFGVHLQFNKKNYLLGKFKKPAITMLFCNDPLQNRRNYFWKTPSESKAEPSHFRNSNGLGLGGSQLRACWCWAAFQPIWCIRSREQIVRHIGPGEHFQFPASSPLSPSASFLNQASMPFLRGQNEEQVAVDWKTAICLS